MTVIASYSGCDETLPVIFFTLGMATMGPYYAGMKLNPLDLSPNYAGSLMAIANGISSISGIMTAIFIGLMTPNVRFHFEFFKITNLILL